MKEYNINELLNDIDFNKNKLVKVNEKLYLTNYQIEVLNKYEIDFQNLNLSSIIFLGEEILEEDDYDDLDEVMKLKKVILDIYSKNKDSKILILGRTNRVINELYNDSDLIDSIGTKLVYKGYNEIKIDAMTIHKSKGLTYDEVILLGLTSGFPNNKRGFWMLNVFRNEDVNEGISFAEERRVFYVAMTRTLNHLYMFVPKDVVKRSPYIKEICEIIANSTVDK